MLLDMISGHAAAGEYVFMLLCVMAAWQIGKSTATDWKGLGALVVSVLLLGLGARFLHFALYEAQFVSVDRYIVDTIVLLISGYLGFRFTRTNQMTRQYHWLYEKASPFSWKSKA